jgi:DNA-binding NtrC family response regulator
LSRIEQDLISRALERTGGNRNRAAELLKIKRTTLVEKLKRLGQSEA